MPTNGVLMDLRGELIREEYDEVVEALEDLRYSTIDQDEKELRAHLLKELCDLVYVCVGTAIDLDMNFDVALTRVHNNNMKKWHKPKFREDGKLEKPEGFETVDLTDLI
jgi:predicted HAD superfamily Cof-like phosphohydrolase